MRPIPHVLHGRPFRREEALALGVSDRMLAGARFVRIHPGVYRTHDTEPTLDLLVDAALLKLPSGTAVSHLTSLRLRGLAIGPVLPIHLARHHPCQVVLRDVVVHRHLRRVDDEVVGGRLVTTPARTFVDCGTLLDERRLLQVGDWLVAQGCLNLLDLRAYCLASHLDGVQRARRVAPLVRERVASPRESDVRWHLHRAGLPEAEVNVDILDEHGGWLARGDLVYRRWLVLVEYDGWQHERDAWQRQRDHLRREALEAAGWRVIVVTTADLRAPRTVALRVRQALRARGLR